MVFAATIEDQIEDANGHQLAYRNLHTNAEIDNLVTEEKLVVPFGSIINKYRYFLKPLVLEIEFTHEMKMNYHYSPKRLSMDLYGTTEYWAALLELNNCKSVIDFNMDKVKVYDPDTILDMINEILILEEVI